METSCLALPSFGRPRSARMGTIAASCLGVSGWASGSLLAAAVMRLSSCAVGMRMGGRLDGLDIVFHLTTIGAAQANHPAHLATIYKCHVVKDACLRSQRDRARLATLKPLINPYQRSFPIQFTRQRERFSVLGLVRLVFGGVEQDLHLFIVATLNWIVNAVCKRHLKRHEQLLSCEVARLYGHKGLALEGIYYVSDSALRRLVAG